MGVSWSAEPSIPEAWLQKESRYIHKLIKSLICTQPFGKPEGLLDGALHSGADSMNVYFCTSSGFQRPEPWEPQQYNRQQDQNTALTGTSEQLQS